MSKSLKQNRDQVWDHFLDLRKPIRFEINQLKKLEKIMSKGLKNKVFNQVRVQFFNQVSDQISGKVWDQLINQIRLQVWHQADRQLRHQLQVQVYDQV